MTVPRGAVGGVPRGRFSRTELRVVLVAKFLRGGHRIGHRIARDEPLTVQGLHETRQVTPNHLRHQFVASQQAHLNPRRSFDKPHVHGGLAGGRHAQGELSDRTHGAARLRLFSGFCAALAGSRGCGVLRVRDRPGRVGSGVTWNGRLRGWRAIFRVLVRSTNRLRPGRLTRWRSLEGEQFLFPNGLWSAGLDRPRLLRLDCRFGFVGYWRGGCRLVGGCGPRGQHRRCRGSLTRGLGRSRLAFFRGRFWSQRRRLDAQRNVGGSDGVRRVLRSLEFDLLMAEGQAGALARGGRGPILRTILRTRRLEEKCSRRSGFVNWGRFISRHGLDRLRLRFGVFRRGSFGDATMKPGQRD